MQKWKVVEGSKVAKQLKQDFENGVISTEDINCIKLWVSEMEEYGPDYIRKSRLWNDHSLQDKWKGYRSSCFSYRGRIIYRIENDQIIITVVRITATHDYR